MPDGNGRFSLASIGISEMNDAGQIAFRASLTGSSRDEIDNAGIFLWEENSGLTQIARKGDLLFGSEIVNLRDVNLNNLGEIAFTFSLADGRKGIAIWAVPEPVTLLLLCIGAVLATHISRRR